MVRRWVTALATLPRQVRDDGLAKCGMISDLNAEALQASMVLLTTRMHVAADEKHLPLYLETLYTECGRLHPYVLNGALATMAIVALDVASKNGGPTPAAALQGAAQWLNKKLEEA